MSTHHVFLRPAERLARSAPSEIEDARRRVGAVIVSARALTRVLPDAEADPVALLARRLATLPWVTPTATDDLDRPTAEAAFRDALVHSLDAVRTCRQTLHVSGACWFADVAGEDGCGEVLRTAHALSS